MDQVLYISKLSGLKYFQNDFTRIYFGQEFCERLLPKIDDLERMVAFSEEKDVPLTFVTPYVTDSGLAKLENTICFLRKKMTGAEVVFNDWGVYQFMEENHLDVKTCFGTVTQ